MGEAMCYSGTCQYEYYRGDGDCGCRRGDNPCPADEEPAEEHQEDVGPNGE